MRFEKIILDLNRYEELGIDQRYTAYQYIFHDISQNQSDDLELEYLQKGHKIFHVDLKRTHGTLFCLTLIAAKLEVIF